ncbi:hypothetical protein L798_05928 [Zootermopsis nevadensis]|uniref:Uncharacterized protein n=1 Tax=Zootermopsis nevadensis TaxID=136037 RepID=A0A067RHV3_ZOONE|nr:hypothetical protein L798_05928 [Zootermopsis nevadensis]
MHLTSKGRRHFNSKKFMIFFLMCISIITMFLDRPVQGLNMGIQSEKMVSKYIIYDKI